MPSSITKIWIQGTLGTPLWENSYDYNKHFTSHSAQIFVILFYFGEEAPAQHAWPSGNG